MGVPYLFRWISMNCGNAIQGVYKNQRAKSKMKCFALDLNAIFHPCVQNILKDRLPEKAPQNFLFPTLQTIAAECPTDKEFFKEICDTIEKLRRIINPTKTLFLSVDGIAGLSKQFQQKQRRFRSVQLKSKDEFEFFDTNSISCGTKFMDDLCRYIHIFIQKQITYNSGWKNLEVIFSNHKDPGEGEAKILTYIRKQIAENGNEDDGGYCINSPDADLILLAMGLDYPSVYIFRENMYKYSSNVPDFNLVNISILKNFFACIAETSNFPKDGTVYDRTIQNRVATDIIFLFCLFGNDFLSCTNFMQISNNSIDMLMKCYSENHLVCGQYLVTKSEDNKTHINNQLFQNILQSVSVLEEEFLQQQAIMKGFKCITDYKKDWYKRKLDISTQMEIKKVCHAHFKGMKFVLDYYVNKLPDWHFRVTNRYCAFASDLAKHSETFDFQNVRFQLHQPLLPLEQLLSVLPPASSKLLPACLAELMINENSILKSYYPTEFVVDNEDKHQEYESIVLVPHVNLPLLQAEFKKKMHLFTEEEKKRNRPGLAQFYKFDIETNSCAFKLLK